MAVRALSLSGGGARGSFQLGALAALYDVYGFRPDIIAGTSVGSVNGIMLALARPPKVNDPAAILASAAAGTPDSGLIALRALEAEWATFLSTTDFFAIQPAFRGTLIEDLLKGLNAPPTGQPPPAATLGWEIDLASVLLSLPVVNGIFGPVAAGEVQKHRSTVFAVLSENSVFNLDPISRRLHDPAKLTLAALAAGTPVFFAAVALESGRLRYIDGTGTFTERDGKTPVMSALTDSDIDAALDENGQPLDTNRVDRIKDLVGRYRAAVGAVAAGNAAFTQASTSVPQRLAILTDIARNKARGNYLLEALHTQVRDLRLTTRVDPRQGVLASAAMPVFFDPIVIGGERYIDGGVREIIPMEIAVRAGVTEVVGICCSSLELPGTDDLGHAGLAAVGLRALTEIALQEVTYSDIEAVRAKGIPCTVIAPGFDVHGATAVSPSLIEISTDYGWMRACDEMQPASDAERNDFRRLSDLITSLRLTSYRLEVHIGENAWFLNAAGVRGSAANLRSYRWILRELLARRTGLGLPTHPQTRRWWLGWAREFRPVGPFGTTSVWAQLSAFSSKRTEVSVAGGVSDPDSYAPDNGSLVDAGNDRVYWVVRGAAFHASGETELTTMRTPALLVPGGTVASLPRIPRGSHLMAEADTPDLRWIVRDAKRYRSTPALIVASGMAGQPVAVVPPGGLDQIPDGGSPFWLGGLYPSDSQQKPIDRWEPTPQVEGSSSSTAIGLTNRLPRPVIVTGLTIASNQDGGGSSVFSVTDALPLTVPPNSFVWVNAQFHPLRPGAITGTVSLTCDDLDVPQFTIPLASAATPSGPHGFLEILPANLDFGAIAVGQSVGRNVTLINVGVLALDLVGLRVADSPLSDQFGIPYSLPTQLAPGGSATVYVSCTPTLRGRLRAALAVDLRSATSTTHPFRQHLDVPLAATAQAPAVFIAGSALPPQRRPVRVLELGYINFGAVAPDSAVVRPFWIRNVGELPLAVAGVDSTQQGAFGITDTSIFPAVVEPRGEMQIEANFLAPPAGGMRLNAEFRIRTDDPLRPVAVLAVAGHAAGPHLTLQPPELLDLAPGAPPAGELTILSDGTDPVTFLEVLLDNPEFSFGGFPPLPARLDPGTSLRIAVTFLGTNPGQHHCRVTLIRDAGGARLETLVYLRALT